MATDSILDMITDGRPAGAGVLHRGYYIGASCNHAPLAPSAVGPRVINWLAHYMAPKGHVLVDDGFPGNLPTDYTPMLQYRLDQRILLGVEDFNSDWGVLGFSGQCIIDALSGEPYSTITEQITNLGLMQQLVDNAFFEEICSSVGRSVPYLYDSLGADQEEFDEKWTAYAIAYKAAMIAEGATPIPLWKNWQPANTNVPPFNELGDYHPSNDSHKDAAQIVLSYVEQVYS